ncbi:MAG: DUF4494 domain-containing protein [Bacteroidetes bacterium]|nr:DUF4494 domain-containing protein [Bacteroidota bacterium]
MPSWSLVKIKYQQEQENGGLKTITESYLIDCVSFTDAEARAHKVVSENRSLPDFTIFGISKMKLSDVFHFEEEGGEKWFKCKTVYISIDDSRGAVREKKYISFMLVNADSPKQAIERIEKSLATILIPYEITDVNLTPILEVYPYVGEVQKE